MVLVCVVPWVFMMHNCVGCMGVGRGASACVRQFFHLSARAWCVRAFSCTHVQLL
jgi:hypothetical protein